MTKPKELWLKLKAQEITAYYWGKECHIPIRINTRLKKTLGMYLYEKENQGIIPIAIELSKEMIIYASEEIIIHILKHEICHYILSLSDLPFLDGEKTFEEELNRIQAPSSKMITIGYCVQCAMCQKVYYCKTNAQAKKLAIAQKTTCCQAAYCYKGVKYELKK